MCRLYNSLKEMCTVCPISWDMNYSSIYDMWCENEPDIPYSLQYNPLLERRRNRDPTIEEKSAFE